MLRKISPSMLLDELDAGSIFQHQLILMAYEKWAKLRHRGNRGVITSHITL